MFPDTSCPFVICQFICADTDLTICPIILYLHTIGLSCALSAYLILLGPSLFTSHQSKTRSTHPIRDCQHKPLHSSLAFVSSFKATSSTGLRVCLGASFEMEPAELFLKKSIQATIFYQKKPPDRRIVEFHCLPGHIQQISKSTAECILFLGKNKN
jgi:hypothetical protein